MVLKRSKATSSKQQKDQFDQAPELEILTIDDFSPGVINYARGGLGNIQAPYAPIGSAAIAQRCINQPGIGLVPMPTWSLQHEIGIMGGAENIQSSGLYSAGPNQPTNTYSGTQIYVPNPLPMYTDEMIFFAVNCTTSSDTSNCLVYRYETNTGNVVNLSNDQISYPAVQEAFWRGIVFQEFITSVTVNQSGISNFLRAFVVWGSVTYANSPTGSNSYTGNVYVTPNPTTTAETFSFPIPVVDGVPTGTKPLIDMVISYNARLMTLASSPLAGTYYNTGNSISQNSAFVNNTALFITDPPQTFTWATLGGAYVVQSNFDESEIYEIGAFGTQSSGELILIKAGGGALYVTGDLASPSVTKLPAVTGTGNQHSRAVSSPAGLIYLCDLNGAWAWNGSNTSAKISVNLPDDALQAPITTSTIGPFSGATSFHECWNDWVLFANNWCYDTESKSWWQIESPYTLNFCVWSKSSTQSNFIWCMPFNQPVASQVNLYVFDSTIPASTWLWVSNPIPASVGALIELGYVEILASNPTVNECIISVNPLGHTSVSNNPGQAISFTIPPLTQSIRLSFPFGFNDYNIQLEVQGINLTAGQPAPVLHEISIGFQRSASTALS